jgi:hypothetical protein
MERYFLLMLFGIIFGSYKSVGREVGRDIREECRAVIAGHYFQLLNDVERTSSFVVTIKTKLTSLKQGLIVSRKQLKQMVQQRDQQGYNFEREQEVKNAKDHLALLLMRQASESILLEKYQKDLKKSLKSRKTFKDKFLKVFLIEHDKDIPGFNIRVLYRHSCHEFEFLCPLPKKQAQSLTQILGGETPTSCQRYAQVSPLKRPKDPD